MNPIYYTSILPISYLVFISIKENIDKKYEQKRDIIKLNVYYKQHLQCLQERGFNYDIEKELKEPNFPLIIGNKDIKELESCKNTYLNFLMAYRKLKNNNF